MPILTVSKFTLFKELSEDTTAATYDVPYTILKSIMKISIQKEVSVGECTAEGVTVERASRVVKYKIKIQLKDLTSTERAMVMGKTTTNGIDTSNTDDDPPNWCVAFMAKKTNKKNKYYKFYKVKFLEPDEDFDGDTKITYTGLTLEGDAIPRLYDGNIRLIADEDDPTYIPATGTNWFTSANITSDITPPTISSSTPANNATAIAVTSAFVWTFSEAILPACVLSANFFVVKDSDGSVVPGTLALNGAKTTVTFTPSSNLSAATAYRAVATTNVKDLSNNALAANDVRKFTTA